jgi:tetratricopeptide (TPR) repeat protein
MTGLVVQQLPGDGGPRALAVSAGASVPDREALAIARRTGAGRYLRGSVATGGGRLIFSATLKSTANDSILARVDNLNTTRDSLPGAVDRILSRLLTASLLVSDGTRAALAALPLAALRAYLAAERAFTLGQNQEAARLFATVLDVDSTCYPAALGLGAVTVMDYSADRMRRAVALANAERRRMEGPDIVFLHALAWPLENRNDLADRLARFDAAANSAQGSGSIKWYLLGERLFHDGPFLGAADALGRAAASFARALMLDPEFVPALRHAIDLAAARGDTGTVRRLATRYFALDSTGNLSDYYRWRVAVSLGDRRGLEAVRSRIDRMSKPSLERIVNVAQLDGVSVADAILAASMIYAHSGATSEARWGYTKQRELALNRGRPAEANAILAQWRSSTVQFRERDAFAEVVDALFWGADTLVPSQWVQQTAAALSRGVRSRATGNETLFFQLCGVALWRVLRGDTAGTAATLNALRTSFPDSAKASPVMCADVADVAAAARMHAPDARARLTRLDNATSTAPPAVITWMLAAANLTVARLWEANGDAAKALAAVRRRPYITDIGEPRVLVALSTMLREEGRLSAMTGDTASAISAYRRYLALRSEPEPSVAAEVDTVKAALNHLTRGSSPKR